MKKYLVISAAAIMAATAPAYMTAANATEHAVEETAADAHADAPAAVEHTLEDGTVVHVKDGHVFVVDEHGEEVAAPDGTHTLEDGTHLEVFEGMIVEGDEGHDEHADDAAAE